MIAPSAPYAMFHGAAFARTLMPYSASAVKGLAAVRGECEYNNCMARHALLQGNCSTLHYITVPLQQGSQRSSRLKPARNMSPKPDPETCPQSTSDGPPPCGPWWSRARLSLRGQPRAPANSSPELSVTLQRFRCVGVELFGNDQSTATCRSMSKF